MDSCANVYERQSEETSHIDIIPLETRASVKEPIYAWDIEGSIDDAEAAFPSVVMTGILAVGRSMHLVINRVLELFKDDPGFSSVGGTDYRAWTRNVLSIAVLRESDVNMFCEASKVPALPGKYLSLRVALIVPESFDATSAFNIDDRVIDNIREAGFFPVVCQADSPEAQSCDSAASALLTLLGAVYLTGLVCVDYADVAMILNRKHAHAATFVRYPFSDALASRTKIVKQARGVFTMLWWDETVTMAQWDLINSDLYSKIDDESDAKSGLRCLGSESELARFGGLHVFQTFPF